MPAPGRLTWNRWMIPGIDAGVWKAYMDPFDDPGIDAGA